MKDTAFRAFLKKVFANPASVSKLELVLMSAKGGSSVVDTIRVEDPRDYSTEDRFEELLAGLCETAQRDANGWGTPSRYCLRARFQDEDANPRSTVMAVHPDDDSEPDDYAGEPANATGLVAQAHRHTEAFARQLVAQTAAFTQHATDMMARQSETLQRLERDRLNTLELIEDLQTKKHERELELRKEERRDKNVARMVDAVAPLLPIAGGKLLLGAKAPVQVRNSPQMASLRELAKSFTADDLARLQGALGPERFAAILEVITSIAEEGPHDAETAGSDTDNGSGESDGWH